MGRIKSIISQKEVSIPNFNNRFTVELCENIHLHYRNIRLEFTQDEFILILEYLKSINKNDIINFKYSDYSFKCLVEQFNLPENVFYNKRLQIEEQIEGHFHFHYRNLRIESDSLQDIGQKSKIFYIKYLKYIIIYFKRIIQFKFFETFFSTKEGKTLLNNDKFEISENYKKYISQTQYYKYSICRVKISNLNVILATKDGWHVFNINNSPAYNYLKGKIQLYNQYNEFKKQLVPTDINSSDRFKLLLNNIKLNGYDKNKTIIINHRNEIRDGQHRAAYLLHTHGKDYEIEVLKIYFKTKKKYLWINLKSYLSGPTCSPSTP